MKQAGNTNVVELNPSLRGDGAQGVKATRRFRGLRGELLNMVHYINAPGITWDLEDDDPPFAILEVRFGDAQDGTPLDSAAVTTPIWSMDGNDLEKSLWEHPDLATWLDDNLPANGVPDQAWNDVVNELRDLVDGSISLEDVPWWNNIPEEPARIVGLMLKKVESFTVSQYVLRRVVIVPGTYSGTMATANANKQFTKTQLQTAEFLPNALFFELPSAGAWLKRTPSMRQLEDGRWEITNEWWHADVWSAALYPPVT